MPKFAVKLAIDGEQRLARVRENSRRSVPRLRPSLARNDTLAVVGYGPSLKETWQQIKTPFIITTSGAHDFLIERGIIPTWHVEFEPRSHKAFFLQNPHPEVTYCLASVCHDKIFEAVKDHKILMWHGIGGNSTTWTADADIACETEDEDAILLKGGSTAGLRAINVGHVLGFRRFDLFGLDCSYTKNAFHAGPHSCARIQNFQIECNGKIFRTSDTMINAAEELLKTLITLGCKYTIYGEHLFAERIRVLAKNSDLDEMWWKPVGWEPQIIEADEIGRPI